MNFGPRRRSISLESNRACLDAQNIQPDKKTPRSGPGCFCLSLNLMNRRSIRIIAPDESYRSTSDRRQRDKTIVSWYFASCLGFRLVSWAFSRATNGVGKVDTSLSLSGKIETVIVKRAWFFFINFNKKIKLYIIFYSREKKTCMKYSKKCHLIILFEGT